MLFIYPSRLVKIYSVLPLAWLTVIHIILYIRICSHTHTHTHTHTKQLFIPISERLRHRKFLYILIF